MRNSRRSGKEAARSVRLFGVVSIPLGMSFYIRNRIQFHMPLVWIIRCRRIPGSTPEMSRF